MYTSFMDARTQEVLERLEAHAPNLSSVLGSTGVLLHTPEGWYARAIDDVEKILNTLPGDLMGAKEASEVLGVARPNLYTMPGMPKPRARLGMGSVWDAGPVRQLAKERADHHKRKRRS